MPENDERNVEEDDADDTLFVWQDGEGVPVTEEQDQSPEQDAIEPEKPDGGKPEDPELADDEELDVDQVSQAGSESASRNDPDGDYIDRDEVPAQEESKTQEEAAAPAEPSEDTLKRHQLLLKGGAKRKDSTIQYLQHLRTDSSSLRQQLSTWRSSLAPFSALPAPTSSATTLDASDAEEKLSLKISKSDFAKMKIVGQFNLGFIIAVREASPPDASPTAPAQDDEVFIIDQHASDEKFNFERLQTTTVVQSQRLVQPKTLELTAMEEEVIMASLPALETNGFNVHIDPAADVGSRIQLLSLPLSRETTFSLADLEELIFLLGENPTSGASTVPRPGKVRRMFAMRACRASIMIGKALSAGQMGKVVRHMGEMEKPWNCPHGRPTMRHLCGLGAWDERGWREGEGDGGYGEGQETDWGSWLAGR